MFSFLKRVCSHPSSRPHRARPCRRLRLEILEGRWVPSAVPVIDSLAVFEESSGGVGVTGHVVDESPTGLTVTLTGAVWGSAPVDADGYFATSVFGASLGTVSATVIDGDGQESAAATDVLTSDVPAISSLTVTESVHGQVIITGSIEDESPSGLMITLAGAASEHTTADSDGNFSVTVSGCYLGTVSATVTDWFGQASAAVTREITSNAPTITNFTAIVDQWDQLHVEGQVGDEDPQGLQVVIVWLGQSYQVGTDYQGRFRWSCEVQVGQEGWASAQTADWWGIASSQPELFVDVV